MRLVKRMDISSSKAGLSFVAAGSNVSALGDSMGSNHGRSSTPWPSSSFAKPAGSTVDALAPASDMLAGHQEVFALSMWDGHRHACLASRALYS